MISKYQTLTSFLLEPFHQKNSLTRDTEYDTKYRKFVAENKIRIFAMCQIEDSYYIHIKVPSESQKSKGYEYDVIIRFFPPNGDIEKQSHIRNYYIQFFSNSPSFMYQYAYLYKKEGFLIEALYNKLDADYIDIPPEKTNKEMKISYDKSIYFACRFLEDKKFRYLDKTGMLLNKKVSERRFFSNISDFQSIKIDQILIGEEKKLSREIKKKNDQERVSRSQGKIKKRTPVTNTFKNEKPSSINIVVKKTPKGKIVAKKTTKKTSRR